MSLDFFLQQPSVLRGKLADILNQNPHTLWDNIKSSPPELLLSTFFVFFITSGVIYRLSASAFPSFLVGLFLTLIYYSYKFEQTKNEVDVFKKKVKRLERTMQRKNNIFSKSARSLLHRNPALVNCFANMYVIARYDKKNFKDALISANQLIRIYESVKLGVVLPDQMIDIAEELQRNTMNYIHSIINSLPSSTVGDFRWQVNMNILQQVLQKITNDIKLLAKFQYEKTGATIYNPPPDYRSGTWANPLNSPEYSENWNQYY